MTTEMSGVERRWADALAAWAVPSDVLSQASESPYVWPTSLFKRTGDQLDTPSYHAALAALPTGGSVLDVGVGAGWASLPLAPPATRIIGVDPDPGMLAAFSRAADEKGVVHSKVDGSWPEVASRVECADVAVSHHVVYDVPGLAPFLLALAEHARRRVVAELTEDHPAAWLNPLWRHFHGIERPMRPTADDVFAIARNIGLDPEMTTWQRSPWTRGVERREVVEFVRRRLCLGADRDDEVDVLLGPDPGTRSFVTLWWAGTGA